MGDYVSMQVPTAKLWPPLRGEADLALGAEKGAWVLGVGVSGVRPVRGCPTITRKTHTYYIYIYIYMCARGKVTIL